MKHKHCELIKAWADGAEIETQYGDGTWEVIKNPMFYDQYKYRIKPEEKKPVVRWLWAYQITSGGYEMTSFLTDREALTYPLPLIKLEWSRTEFPE